MMSHLWKFSFFFLLTVYLVNANISFAQTNSNLEDLNPNEYRNQQFKDNTEYIHNDSLLERRKNISETQKQLDFLPKDTNKNGEIKKQLFKEGFEEHKTLTYESTKLLLFTNSEKQLQLADRATESINNTKSIKNFYIGIIFSLVLLMFLFLFPRVIRNTSIKQD